MFIIYFICTEGIFDVVRRIGFLKLVIFRIVVLDVEEVGILVGF